VNSKLRAIPVVACSLALLLCARLAAQQRNDSERVAKHKQLSWAPPNVDGRLASLAASPPCPLPKVLEQAGAHALELTTNLENFTAQEQIEYEKLTHNGLLEENDSSTFNYVFAFEQHGEGVSREYRTPTKQGHTFPASGQDTGQAALALIFRPKRQDDYEMSCEGLDKWNGQSAWVIRFQQRKDKPRRTVGFSTGGREYSAMLKGRAWISMDSGQVLHQETKLMQDIPELNLRSSAVSVDYAPVQIQSRKLELWLPQRIEAFWELSNVRIILFHTFSDFKLFSVDTEQTIQPPKTP
jgi:hypothetical protein